MGGIYANANNGTTSIGGATHVYVNGGSITGDVMGGGLAGSISGGSNAPVTGGVIAGSVYGAGTVSYIHLALVESFQEQGSPGPPDGYLPKQP